MLVQATRKASAATLRIAMYAGLFVTVVLVHLSLTSVLRGQGLGAGPALLASGLAVLATVVTGVQVARWWEVRLAADREEQRQRLRLPVGPCCVVWRAVDGARAADAETPWEVVGAMRANYPKLPLALGIEGVAVVEFEVDAGGRAKTIHCIDAWPSDLFYDAAREALRHARFAPKHDMRVRYGESYRLPFVFRIEGAARIADHGRRARRLRPALRAAWEAVGKLRRGAGAIALTR